MNRNRFVVLLPLLLAIGAAAQHKSSVTPSPSIPAGTAVQVRVIENLSSASAQAGQTFHGTLAEPIVVNNQTLYAKGADVIGKVVSAKPSGRLSDPGVLVLSLSAVSDATHKTYLKTEPFEIKGKSHTKSNVTKIGGGAAAGAVLGAIVGGGKGAAIGAGVGAAAGTGVAAATGKKDASVESEAILAWNVTSSTPVNGNAASSTKAAGNKTTVAKEYNDTSGATGVFSSRDQRMIRSCFTDHASELPPGLAKRESLPPGIQRQLERGGSLPPGLQKKVQPMPQVCENGLSVLPSGQERVVYGNRVMLVDSSGKILDAFNLSE